MLPSTSRTEGAPAHGNAAHLLPPHFKQTVSEWLREDAPSFDYGGFVVGESPAEAKLLGKSAVSCSDLWTVGVARAIHQAKLKHESSKMLQQCH